MADEIKISVSASNSSLQDDFKPSVFLTDQTTLGAAGGITVVGTSEEDIVMSDITSPGWFMMTNLDSANFITYGPEDTTMTVFGKLLAGESCIFKLEPSATLRWKADTAAVKVQWKCWEV